MSRPPSHNLRDYLELEARMVRADADGREDEADRLRDQMDPLWDALDDDERAALRSRRLEPA